MKVRIKITSPKNVSLEELKTIFGESVSRDEKEKDIFSVTGKKIKEITEGLRAAEVGFRILYL
ncbi:MAG: hypothetical protein WC609_01205 [Candidatus Paceibacterota bacterium]|jgi:hypothetical protein